MLKNLETRPHPRRDNRVQVKLNGRWRSHRGFTTTCWSWAGGGWCKGEVEYWTEEGCDDLIIMRCQKCGATRRRWPGYRPPEPPRGGFQHGWLRTRRAYTGY